MRTLEKISALVQKRLRYAQKQESKENKMITQEQYKHAGKMLSLLDMDANEDLYHKYLDIALDYESENGYFCSDFLLNKSLISQHQTLMPRRSSGAIILIIEPVLQVS